MSGRGMGWVGCGWWGEDKKTDLFVGPSRRKQGRSSDTVTEMELAKTAIVSKIALR